MLAKFYEAFHPQQGHRIDPISFYTPWYTQNTSPTEPIRVCFGIDRSTPQDDSRHQRQEYHLIQLFFLITRGEHYETQNST